jgi:agmatine deiminase
MVYTPQSKGDFNDRVMRDNLARLRSTHDAKGRTLEIIEIPEPAPCERHDGRRLDMSYINFYYANYGVVMPSFGDALDGDALWVVQKTFPEKRVVQVPCFDIVQGGGGIHCITQQQPAGQALKAERFER